MPTKHLDQKPSTSTASDVNQSDGSDDDSDDVTSVSKTSALWKNNDDFEIVPNDGIFILFS